MYFRWIQDNCSWQQFPVSRVQACGIDAEDVFAYDAPYGSAFVGSLGVKQESDSWEWGLSYRYSANSNQHSNDIMANIDFKF